MTTATGPLSEDQLTRLDAWWRACNYLAAGMIYLRDNPLLREPLRPEHINVIVADKQNHLQFLDRDAAIAHCTKGLGIWDWASIDQGVEPDVVMVGCGDIPTQEALAATGRSPAGITPTNMASIIRRFRIGCGRTDIFQGQEPVMRQTKRHHEAVLAGWQACSATRAGAKLPAPSVSV